MNHEVGGGPGCCSGERFPSPGTLLRSSQPSTVTDCLSTKLFPDQRQVVEGENCETDEGTVGSRVVFEEGKGGWDNLGHVLLCPSFLVELINAKEENSTLSLEGKNIFISVLCIF